MGLTLKNGQSVLKKKTRKKIPRWWPWPDQRCSLRSGRRPLLDILRMYNVFDLLMLNEQTACLYRSQMNFNCIFSVRKLGLTMIYF